MEDDDKLSQSLLCMEQSVSVVTVDDDMLFTLCGVVVIVFALVFVFFWLLFPIGFCIKSVLVKF